MLVPGISDVFKIYHCGEGAFTACDAAITTVRISAGSWGVCIALGAGTFVVHFLGRWLIHLKKEFNVTQKRIDKDIAKIAKKAEEKRKKEEKDALKNKNKAIKMKPTKLD